MYRKYTGKLSWLASNCRPDLAITALLMSKKNSNATIKDLKKINVVIGKIRERPNRVEFARIGKKEDLTLNGLTDASYKTDENSIGGTMVLLGNGKDTTVAPLHWKSKTTKKVCHSAKAAETRSMTKLLDDTQFFAIQLEQLFFGKYVGKMLIHLFTDSGPLLDSVGSIHQVEEKLLRNSTTQDL